MIATNDRVAENCFRVGIPNYHQEMAQMINKGKELIRINPSNKNKIEYSTNDGRSWNTRYSGSSCGDFRDLTDNGKEILVSTSKGLYYSTNEGRSWNKRS